METEAAHEQIALLDGLARAAEHIAITRKTLLELTDEVPLAPAAALPDGPAYQQNGRVRRSRRPLACAQRVRSDGPERRTEQRQQRPRQTEAFDQARILAETEPGLFTRPRPQSPGIQP
ncbi:hypothetical protein ACFWWM_35075 [Streptomyces sp. NPDC058682]|uniref:hypothetical protein n=1 Tax=Streptomyces sp. NPDC058682 TaxID=3346596 RepID=UPI003657C158